MGGCKPNFVQVSKKFVSVQFELMKEQAEADGSLIPVFGLRRINDELVSTSTTEHLIFRVAQATCRAEGGISHAELDRRMAGSPLGFWIYIRRSNGQYTILDTVQTPGYEMY